MRQAAERNVDSFGGGCYRRCKPTAAGHLRMRGSLFKRQRPCRRPTERTSATRDIDDNENRLTHVGTPLPRGWFLNVVVYDWKPQVGPHPSQKPTASTPGHTLEARCLPENCGSPAGRNCIAFFVIPQRSQNLYVKGRHRKIAYVWGRNNRLPPKTYRTRWGGEDPHPFP